MSRIQTTQPANRTKRPRGNSSGQKPGEPVAEPSQILRRLLVDKVSVTQRGERREVTKLEALLLQLSQAGMAGNVRAFQVLRRYRKLLPPLPERSVEVEFHDGPTSQAVSAAAQAEVAQTDE